MFGDPCHRKDEKNPTNKPRTCLGEPCNRKDPKNDHVYPDKTYKLRAVFIQNQGMENFQKQPEVITRQDPMFSNHV